MMDDAVGIEYIRDCKRASSKYIQRCDTANNANASHTHTNYKDNTLYIIIPCIIPTQKQRNSKNSTSLLHVPRTNSSFTAIERDACLRGWKRGNEVIKRVYVTSPLKVPRFIVQCRRCGSHCCIKELCVQGICLEQDGTGREEWQGERE